MKEIVTLLFILLVERSRGIHRLLCDIHCLLFSLLYFYMQVRLIKAVKFEVLLSFTPLTLLKDLKHCRIAFITF